MSRWEGKVDTIEFQRVSKRQFYTIIISSLFEIGYTFCSLSIYQSSETMCKISSHQASGFDRWNTKKTKLKKCRCLDPFYSKGKIFTCNQNTKWTEKCEMLCSQWL